MVRLNRIYTRTGDDGTTGLGTGERRLKSDPRIEAYGVVDETNAAVGLARLHAAREDASVDAMLGRIQNDLFDLGADLCTPEPAPDAAPLGWTPLRIAPAQVERLEREIDAMNEAVPALRSFVLPGGTPAATYLHLARTLCRTAERLMVALSQDEAVSAPALAYVNRLSDHLFVASRYLNREAGDVLWVPGQNR